MMKSLVIFSVIGLLCAFSPAHARRRSATATGRVLCQINGASYPVEYATVRLKDQDIIFHDTFGSTRSDSSGRFTVSGSAGDLFGKPDPFIQVRYEYTGWYGNMKVQNELGTNRRDRTSKRSYARYISFGDIYFSSDHCKAYVMTYRAMKNYRSLSGKSLPYSRLKVVTHAPIHGGTPYSTTDKIRIPSGYNYDFGTAKHELAHTVRHSLDGTFAHFLRDVIRYTYTQNHYCGKKTNEGFAFNEGWAELWEGSCFLVYGSSPTDYTYEGNVAKALRALRSRCGSSYGQMVDVLQGNRGHIHSYGQFAAAHRVLYGCS